jgi:hypothetical protein
MLYCVISNISDIIQQVSINSIGIVWSRNTRWLQGPMALLVLI